MLVTLCVACDDLFMGYLYAYWVPRNGGWSRVDITHEVLQMQCFIPVINDDQV